MSISRRTTLLGLALAAAGFWAGAAPAVAQAPKEIRIGFQRAGIFPAVKQRRTVEEALTNVRRHSTARSAQVVVRVAEHYVEAEILDAGRPVPGTSGTGLGQLGMRERAAHHHGEVEIGPRPTGGYRVRVRLPLMESQ